MNRLFLALVPEGLGENPELKQLLGKFKRTLAEKDKDCKWVPKVNWHVTLVFLGAVSEEKTEEAKDLLNIWKPSSHSPLELQLTGVGAFPDNEAARALWLGVAAEQELLDMQSSIEGLYTSKGFKLEQTHSYRPHLTLVRFRNPVHANELIKLGGRKSFGRYSVGEIVLFESVLQGPYPKYIPVLRRPFAKMHNS